MRCIPEPKNARAVRLIIAALLIGGGIIYAIPVAARAAGVIVPELLFTVLTIACIVAAVFLLVRYQMTGFQYVIRTKDETDVSGFIAALEAGARLNLSDLPPEMLDFAVYRSQGRGIGIMECLLGLEQLRAVYPLETGRGSKKNAGREARGIIRTKAQMQKRYASEGYVSYDYTVTFLPERTLGLVFIDGNRTVGIIIEPDEEMRAFFLAQTPGERED